MLVYQRVDLWGEPLLVQFCQHSPLPEGLPSGIFTACYGTYSLKNHMSTHLKHRTKWAVYTIAVLSQ